MNRQHTITSIYTKALLQHEPWQTFATPEQLKTPDLERDILNRITRCRACNVWDLHREMTDDLCFDCQED